MAKSWEEWCRGNLAIAQLIESTIADFNEAFGSAQQIAPGPHRRVVLASMFFEVEKLARMSELFFGKADTVSIENLFARVRALAEHWGETEAIDCYMASVDASTTRSSEPSINKSAEALAWDIALEILNTPLRPPRGRGRRTALARLVMTNLASRGIPRELDTVVGYISPGLDDWEQKNPKL